jgi:hypothetical protein
MTGGCLLPGFVTVWGVSYFSPTVESWIAASQPGAPSVAGFMYVTLASLGAGLTVSGIRWTVCWRPTLRAWSCRPRGAAGQDRPHAQGPLPTCVRSRSVAGVPPLRPREIGGGAGAELTAAAGMNQRLSREARGRKRPPCSHKAAGCPVGQCLRIFRLVAKSRGPESVTLATFSDILLRMSSVSPVFRYHLYRGQPCRAARSDWT